MINTSIKNIVFDVGNVLFKYKPTHIVNSLLPDSEYKEFYVEHLFNAPIWQSLDRGDIDATHAATQLSKTHNLSEAQHNDILNLIQNFYKHLILDAEMKNLYIKLSQSYNIYIISNFQHLAFNLLKQMHPFLNENNGIVISSEIRMKKPELGIFHYFLTNHRVLPNQSIFIDDLAENIQSAKKILMKGIQHINYNQTVKSLLQYNIKVS